MKEIPIGLHGRAETLVTRENTAQAVASGTLAVFATPMMIALMEQAALSCVAPYLDEGESTVGTLMNISHDSATPVGMNVRAEAELTAVDRRRLVFTVSAYDDAGCIGKGTHERFVVSNEKFLKKTYAKLP